MAIVNNGETVELLQQLIRNECVNDGTPDSGNERVIADLLQNYLEGTGLDAQCFTSQGDRTSIVARSPHVAGHCCPDCGFQASKG